MHVRLRRNPRPACFAAVLAVVFTALALSVAVARPRHAAAGDLLYVTAYRNYYSDYAIFAYPLDAVLAGTNPKPVETIYGFPRPVSLAVDATENLYVADDIANTVYVFHKGHTQPFGRYLADLSHPVSAVVGHDGTLFVLNTPPKRAPYVLEFAPLSFKAPERRITQFITGVPAALHVDASGNLYVGCATAAGAGAVDVFAPGQTTGTQFAPAAFPSPLSLALDGQGNFLVLGSTVTTGGGPLGVLGTFASLTGGGALNGMPNGAISIALTADETTLFVGGPSASVLAFSYPYFAPIVAALQPAPNVYDSLVAVSPADPN